MQHVNASDYMSGSAKRAIDAAMSDHQAQRVGGALAPTVPSPEGAQPKPEAAQPASGASR